MPTGVTVSRTDQLFVCCPKWGDEVEFTGGEIRDGETVAVPSQELNDNVSDADPSGWWRSRASSGSAPLALSLRRSGVPGQRRCRPGAGRRPRQGVRGRVSRAR
jgi:hypothetical protein